MKNKKMSMVTKICGTAAILAVTAVTGFAYTTPYSYVSLDVNPSVEYSLNRFDRVISVTAVNVDGERIVDGLKVKNEKITTAVQKTIDKLVEEGYLTDDEYSGIVIAVSNDNTDKAEDLKKDLEKDFEKEKAEEKDKKKKDKEIDKDSDENTEEKLEEELEEVEEVDMDVVIEAVGRERVEEARKLEVTPGKLNLVQKLIRSLDGVDIDDIGEEELNEYLAMSVKDINKAIKENRKPLIDEEVSEDDDIDKLEEKENDEVDEDEEVEVDEDEDDDDEEKTDKVKENNKPVKEEKDKKDKKDKSENKNN